MSYCLLDVLHQNYVTLWGIITIVLSLQEMCRWYMHFVLLLISLRVCKHVHVFVYMRQNAHVYVGQGTTLSVIPHVPLTFSCTKVFHWPGTHRVGQAHFPMSHSNLPVSVSQPWNPRCVPAPFVLFYVHTLGDLEIELKSSCLQTMYLVHWAISSALLCMSSIAD